MGLRAKQKRFCEEYVIDLNGTQAAIRAGYSKKTANSISTENLTKPDIQEYIQQLQKEIQVRNEITVDECVQILAKIVRVDIADFHDENGSVKSIHDVPENSRVAISEITSWEEFDKHGVLVGINKKIKMLDRKSSVVELMKHLGGYKEDNKQKIVATETVKVIFEDHS